MKMVFTLLHKLSMVGMFIMLMLTVCDVFLRYFFARPIVGGTEITEMLMLCFGLGWAYCTIQDIHVRADFFVARMPTTVRRVLSVANYVMGAFMAGLLSIRMLQEIKWAFVEDQRTVVLGWPVFPSWLILWLSMFFLALSLVWRLSVELGSPGKKNNR
ncbi:MAG: TRAP transporter small permease [Candidatus Bathyarchaeia archaeon]